MKSRARTAASAIALIGAIALVIPAQAPVAAAPPAGGTQGSLAVYTGEVEVAQLAEFRKLGLDHEDVSLGKAVDGRVPVEAVLTSLEAAKLNSRGVKLAPKKVTAKQRSLAESTTVFRSYSEPGGISDELSAAAASHPDIAKLEVIGTTIQGKPIKAVKITKNARSVPDGARPAVLYAGTQHAREWITPEMVRRLMHMFLDGYGTDSDLTQLVNTRELWFLPVANPDGYAFTNDPESESHYCSYCAATR